MTKSRHHHRICEYYVGMVLTAFSNGRGFLFG